MLRRVIDANRRQRITHGLHDDPTKVGQCEHCGQHFIIHPLHAGQRFCSHGHKSNYYDRRVRFFRISDNAKVQLQLEVQG